MSERKRLLHIGCGPRTSSKWIPVDYKDYEEVRADIDPSVEPDVIMDLTNLPVEEYRESFDAVYSSHNIEHLHYWDVEKALKDLYSMLKPSGQLFVSVPDITVASKMISEGREMDVVYTSPSGDVRPMDMIFGYQPMVKTNPYMMHKSVFTPSILATMFQMAGYQNIRYRQENYEIMTVGEK